MSWVIVALRLIHIAGGVFWAGAVWLFARYVEPTATAAGPEGGRFLQRFAGSGYTPAVMSAGLGTIVAGIALMWIDSGGFQPAFMGSHFGIVLSVGALSAVVAAVFGLGLGARNALRLKAVGAAVQGQPGGPTPQQVAEMQEIQGKLRTGGRVAAVLLGVTVVCMAIARYV
jgi:putative copper export protein